MRYQVTHTTRYLYSESVSQCYSLAHLLPRNTAFQSCVKANIEVTPSPLEGINRTDYFGNQVYHYTVQAPHKVLVVTARSEIDMAEQRQNLSLDFGPSCQDVKALLPELSEQNIQAREFRLNSPLIKTSEELADYARESFADSRPFFSGVKELTERIYEDFKYDEKSTDVSTPLSEVMEHRSGVCQDFAHLAIGCLRSLGFCARYVSGYLETLPPPGTKRLVGADASHAWFSAYSPVDGWLDFDPTNNTITAEQHLTTAWGRDYSDVTPLKGTVFGGGSSHKLEVEVDVERLEAD